MNIFDLHSNFNDSDFGQIFSGLVRFNTIILNFFWEGCKSHTCPQGERGDDLPEPSESYH